MANINKIKLSGTSYDIQDSNAARSVTLTQAQYDALQTKDPNVFYIISDSSIVYMTSADTESAITQAVSGKQDTLVSGTNIKTINNQSLLGSGNISIQAGGISSVEADYDNTVQPNGEFDILINDGSSYSQIFIVGDGLQVTEEYGNTILSATGGGISSGEVQTMIDSSISGKTNQSDFSAHTANTTVHVTAQDKTNWNAKSDFSGSYNDLTDKPTIPTVPTSNTAFTNDAGYITIDAISGKVDTSTYNTYTAATDTALSGKQDTLSAGTNITIVDNVISAEGGGKAIVGGRGITVTSGETADTVSFNLPISADTDGSVNKLIIGSGNTIGSDTEKNIIIGDDNTTFGQGGDRYYTGATIIGYNNRVGLVGIQSDTNDWSFAIGRRNQINGGNSFIIGTDNNFNRVFGKKINYTSVLGHHNQTSSLQTDEQGIGQWVIGAYNEVSKQGETAIGIYNLTKKDGTTSGNTFFTIGNGTAENARHNAFEIRQNGDIYLTKDGQDVKLQDQLGGGGGGNSVVELTQAEYDALVTGGTVDPDTFYVITDAQEIDTDNYYTTAQTQSAITQAVSGKADVSAVTTVNNALTAHTADTTIHVTTAQTAAWDAKQNALTIDSTVTSGSTNPVSGGAVYTQFGGLKLVKLTQAQYNALSTKDSNTLYVIVN